MAAPDDDDPYGLLKKDVTQDDLIGLGGGLFGLQVVCHMLARWVARQDPNFTQESRAEFDKMLGVLHLVISEVLPITRELGLSTNKPTIADSPIVKRALIGGREVFQSIMKDADDKAAAAVPPARRKSLRRRIFEWLERG